MQRFGKTIAFGMVFLGLLIWVVATQRGRVPGKEELFRLQYNQITKLQVTGGQDRTKGIPPGTVFTLEKRGQDWYIAQPVQGLADPDVVSEMIRAFAGLTATHRPQTDPNKPQYGLRQPVLTVTAWWDGGRQSAQLSIGAEAPLEAMRYARLEGQPGTYLVPAVFKTMMDKSADAMRDHKLIRIKDGEIQQFTIAWGGGQVTARYRGPGPQEQPAPGELPEGNTASDSWTLVQPVSAKADKTSVETVTRALTGAEAADFAPLPRNLAKYGLDRPQVTVTLNTRDGNTTTVIFGRQVRQQVRLRFGGGMEVRNLVYAQRLGRDEALLVDASVATDVRKDQMALRDKHILSLDREQVVRIKVQSQEGFNFETYKDGKDWKLAAGGSPLAASRVDGVVWAITDLQAVSYPEENPSDPARYGLSVPATVISAWVSGSNDPIKLYFGKQLPDGTVYLRTSQSHQVYCARDTVSQALPRSAGELRKTEDSYGGAPMRLPPAGGTPPAGGLARGPR